MYAKKIIDIDKEESDEILKKVLLIKNDWTLPADVNGQ